MPRRREVPKRKVLPDPKYHERLVSKLMSVIMRGGKRSIAESIVYLSFEIMGERGTGEEPLKIFKKAVDAVRPMVEVKSRRVGGATYQVPVEIRHERRTALALRWLVRYAGDRSETTMAERLANEMLDACQNRGLSVKKKDDTHRMAEANKAFAHYRW